MSGHRAGSNLVQLFHECKEQAASTISEEGFESRTHGEPVEVIVEDEVYLVPQSVEVGDEVEYGLHDS